jgi:prepilin-type processing-associated H-X9-DG protein
MNRSKVRPQHIVDGTSRTLCFGEAAGGWTYIAEENRQRHTLSYAWMGPGVLPLAHGLIPIQPSTEGFILNRKPGYYQFSSGHDAGAVNFVFVDGSVHAIGKNIDYRVLLSLGGINDQPTLPLEF